MKAFEYQFNPKADAGVFFDVFAYGSGNVYQAKMGNLYIVGSLNNAFEKDRYFIENLAKKIKDGFYRSKEDGSEAALNESLQSANAYLDQILKGGNVGWLGNLNFAAAAIKNKELFFTKVGNVKIRLFRAGTAIDLEEGIVFPGIESNPLRVFGNLAVGKLEPDDALFISTRELDDFIASEKIHAQLAETLTVPQSGEKLDEKTIDAVFSQKEDLLKRLSGACLIVTTRKDVAEESKSDFVPAPYLKKLSLREAFKSKALALPGSSPKFTLPNVPKFPMLKSGALVLAGMAVIGAVYFWMASDRAGKAAALKQSYDEAARQVTAAKVLADAGKKDEARAMLQNGIGAAQNLKNGQASLPPELKTQIESLVADATAALDKVNNVESNDTVPSVFSFADKNFLPEKMAAFDGNLYFLGTAQTSVYAVDQNGEGSLLETTSKFDGVAAGDDRVLFFIKPNKLVYLAKNRFSAPIQLKEPYAGYNYDDFYAYNQNLYFVDKAAGKIVKYPYVSGDTWGLPQIWLSGDAKKMAQEACIAFDRNAWLLNADGTIDKYFVGKLETTFAPSYYPKPERASKIVTGSDALNLYVLDPAQKRIVVLDKQGMLVKQITGQAFGNLSDIALSKDGKTLWVLNGSDLMKIGTEN